MSNIAAFSAPTRYRIDVQGSLDDAWTGRFGDLSMWRCTVDGQPITRLEGVVRDQTQLAGILNTLYELHLPLISMERLSCAPGENDQSPPFG